MIIITGASKGVGQYLFKYFSSKNEKVIGLYNLTSPVDNILNNHKVDVLNFDEVENFVKSNISQLTNITLINCAGITYNSFTHKADPENWYRVIDVNIKGIFNLTRCILPLMREQEFGRIINFSSVVAEKATPGVSAYAASKAALSGFVKSVSIENASKNITINNIDLGYSELGMIKEVPENFLKDILETIPMKRFCKKEEISSCVSFLMENHYITGTSIKLNGGLI